MDRERRRKSLTGGQVCILGLIILPLSSKIASKPALPRRAAGQSSDLIRRITENSCTFRENIFTRPKTQSKWALRVDTPLDNHYAPPRLAFCPDLDAVNL